ncbi:hypothetical protein [Natronospora cellulosivora (SeqCode)]
MIDKFQDLFGDDISKYIPDNFLEIFKNNLEGQIVIKEEEINKYIEELDFKEERVKDVHVKVKDDLLIVQGKLKSKRLRTSVNVEANFELVNWSFAKDGYFLEFELINDPEYNVEGNLAKYLSVMIAPIIDNMVNSNHSEMDLFEEDILEYKNRKLYLKLDEHKAFKKLINKEINIANKSIRPIDYITISDIQLKERKVIVSPAIELQTGDSFSLEKLIDFLD